MTLLLDLYPNEQEYPTQNPVRADDVQAALFAVLTARPALAGVNIDLGWPWRGLQPEHVVIEGDISEWRAVDRSVGKGERNLEENGSILVRVIVQHSSNSYSQIRDRCLALINELELAVRADPTILATTNDAEVVGAGVHQVRDDNGRGNGLELRAEVRYKVALYG